MTVKFHFKHRQQTEQSVDIPNEVSRFLEVKKLERRSPKTIKTYGQTLGKFVEWYVNNEYAKVSTEVIRDYVRFMSQEKERWSDHPTSPTQGVGVSPRSINNIIRVLRIFFNFLVAEKLLADNPASTVKYQEEARDTFEIFSDDDILNLLATPNRRTYTGMRDYTMMLILIDCGCRIGELTNIKVGDINFATRQIVISAEIAKTNETRVVPISQKTVKELRDLVNYVGGNKEDYVFLTQFGERYFADTFAKMLKKYGKKAGITGVRVSPHTFRNYMAVKFLKTNGDPFTLMRILGHKDFAMTNRYIKYSNVDLSEQFDKSSPVMNLIDKGNARKRGSVKFS